MLDVQGSQNISRSIAQPDGNCTARSDQTLEFWWVQMALLEVALDFARSIDKSELLGRAKHFKRFWPEGLTGTWTLRRQPWQNSKKSNLKVP